VSIDGLFFGELCGDFAGGGCRRWRTVLVVAEVGLVVDDSDDKRTAWTPRDFFAVLELVLLENKHEEQESSR